LKLLQTVVNLLCILRYLVRRHFIGLVCVIFLACQKIIQARLVSSGVLIGRSNTPNHIGPVGGPSVRSYQTQQSGPPLPPHPSAHSGSGAAKSFDAQSHSSSGSGSAVPPPVTPTGMTAGGHVRVIISNHPLSAF